MCLVQHGFLCLVASEERSFSVELFESALHVLTARLLVDTDTGERFSELINLVWWVHVRVPTCS